MAKGQYSIDKPSRYPSPRWESNMHFLDTVHPVMSLSFHQIQWFLLLVTTPVLSLLSVAHEMVAWMSRWMGRQMLVRWMGHVVVSPMSTFPPANQPISSVSHIIPL